MKVYSEEDLDSIEQSTLEYLSDKEANLIQLIKSKKKPLEDLLAKAREQISKFSSGISEEIIDGIIENIGTKILGLGILTPLIDREDISDIKLMAYNNIRIKRQLRKDEYKGGKRTTREKADIEFKSVREFDRFIKLLATNNKTSLANIKAEQVVTDSTTSDKFILRIAIATDFVTSTNGCYVHIRKIPKYKYTVDTLTDVGYMTPEENRYLKEAMKRGLSLVVCGKGSAGKTTAINALLEELPHNRAGLIIQESEELFSTNHPELMFLNVRNKVSENDIQYDLQSHSVWGLKVDTDLFGIGEITGAESYYFVNAAYTGYQVIGSVHAFNARAALPKLVHYAKEDIMSMLEDIDVVIYAENFTIREIVEVTGYDAQNNSLKYLDVFKDHKRVSESCEKVLRKLSREV